MDGKVLFESRFMKKTIILAGFFITFLAAGRVLVKFPGWDKLIENSPNVSVVCVGIPILQNPNIRVEGGLASDFEIQTVYILKGTNSVNPTRLKTNHDLSPGENYLVFGYCDNGFLYADEDYRVVPCGKVFSTNAIADKPIDKQLKILLELGLDVVNRRIQKEQSESERLKKGLKGQSYP